MEINQAPEQLEKIFGHIVKSFRKLRKKNQTQIAAEAFVSLRRFQNIEYGLGKSRIDTMERILKSLDLNYHNFVDEYFSESLFSETLKPSDNLAKIIDSRIECTNAGHIESAKVGTIGNNYFPNLLPHSDQKIWLTAKSHENSETLEHLWKLIAASKTKPKCIRHDLETAEKRISFMITWRVEADKIVIYILNPAEIML